MIGPLWKLKLNSEFQIAVYDRNFCDLLYIMSEKQDPEWLPDDDKTIEESSKTNRYA